MNRYTLKGLLFAAMSLLAPSAFANRAVMEGIAASSATVYIDTVNVRVGISTAIPQRTLDVNGTVSISSPIYLNQSPGTIGYVLTSSGAGASPFWGPNVAAASGAQLASTQTFSGANTFLSSTVFNTGVWNTTATYSGITKGVEVVVASITLTAANGFEFTNLSTSYTYTLEANYVQNTSAGSLFIDWNDDRGANLYGYAGTAIYFDGTLANFNANNNQTDCNLFSIGGGAGAAQNQIVNVKIFSTNRNNIVQLNGQWDTTGATTTAWVATGYCVYSGSGQLTRAHIYTTAGTMTGEFTLWARASR